MNKLHPPEEQIFAGKVAGEAILLAKELCKNHIHGLDLDREIETFIRDHRCVPALKGYKPKFSPTAYQHTICLSLNEEAVHGLPDKHVDPNQLISVDLVVGYNGWFADTARTFTYADENSSLYAFANKSLSIFETALSTIIPYGGVSTFGSVVDFLARQSGYSAVSEYCGHGIGNEIHEPPFIQASRNDSVDLFRAGKAFAVEPIICDASRYKLLHSDDGWTVSADCLVSHNEDTIFVTGVGVLNLTAPGGV